MYDPSCVLVFTHMYLVLCAIDLFFFHVGFYTAWNSKFIALFFLMSCFSVFVIICLFVFLLKGLPFSYCDVLLSSAHMTVHLPGSCDMLHGTLLLEAGTHIYLQPWQTHCYALLRYSTSLTCAADSFLCQLPAVASSPWGSCIPSQLVSCT